MKNKSKKGFTLIELLAVIVILAIIALIATPIILGIVEDARKEKVLVIGGGVAGMEAAYVAKKKGHEVVLCEAEAELGGLARLAAVPIGKQDLTKVIKYMANRLEKAGVEVRLNTPVTKELLETEFAGYEVIAGTGAKANVIGAFTNFKQWMTADDILAGKQFPGRKIVR